MSKVTLSLVFSLLASSAFAQSEARVASSAGTDAVRPTPPASASAKSSAGTDAAHPKRPAAAATDSSAGTDASKPLIPQPRKDKQRPDAADKAK
ncbi:MULTISPECIES: hypothetical protein [unclassified Janthinobacterium]|uniref:hypothetical protein n=1 Tax=unclassified Janthinobacterium TaxID=2610881 RepID=UPI00161DE71E|nr:MULTISPECIES: hypothetical protein [unclassified Janthinobacterium]MBB5369754.1 putative membrane protein [Janthinobacterium sp. K2C7]MBB5382290.1 putative membrane protein [Janthinobacterium sp. K2Li3]MBB5387867.1 putative membrane protein [Janthinobacterium sp. K2E3]